MYMVRLDGDTAAADILKTAREECSSDTHCRVMGWVGDAPLPGRLPLLDREVDSQAFDYWVNRETGAEQVRWNCAIFKDATSASGGKPECMAR